MDIYNIYNVDLNYNYKCFFFFFFLKKKIIYDN